MNHKSWKEIQEDLEKLLKDHDVERMACLDHEKYCCPCGEHDFLHLYEHQAGKVVNYIMSGFNRG